MPLLTSMTRLYMFECECDFVYSCNMCNCFGLSRYVCVGVCAAIVVCFKLWLCVMLEGVCIDNLHTVSLLISWGLWNCPKFRGILRHEMFLYLDQRLWVQLMKTTSHQNLPSTQLHSLHNAVRQDRYDSNHRPAFVVHLSPLLWSPVMLDLMLYITQWDARLKCSCHGNQFHEDLYTVLWLIEDHMMLWGRWWLTLQKFGDDCAQPQHSQTLYLSVNHQKHWLCNV